MLAVKIGSLVAVYWIGVKKFELVKFDESETGLKFSLEKSS